MAKVRALPDGALPEFEGKPVRQCTIKITKAGDGLSEALEVAPVALHSGEDVYYVLHGQVERVSFPKFDTLGDELVREHTVATVEIIPVTRDDVDTMLREGMNRIRKLHAERTGAYDLEDPEHGGAAAKAAAEAEAGGTDIAEGRKRRARTPRDAGE